MPAPSAAREARIELRATKKEKRLLATAAACERLELTSYILRNVLPAAREVVDRAERIRLRERDTLRVLDLLENPPEPARAHPRAPRRRAPPSRPQLIPPALGWREQPVRPPARPPALRLRRCRTVLAWSCLRRDATKSTVVSRR